MRRGRARPRPPVPTRNSRDCRPLTAALRYRAAAAIAAKAIAAGRGIERWSNARHRIRPVVGRRRAHRVTFYRAPRPLSSLWLNTTVTLSPVHRLYIQQLMPDADEQLLVEAAQRDPSRFAALYERHFDRVYAYAAYRLRDRDAAEDVTAEVFHKALANLGRYEWRGAPFGAWLLRIAAHAIVDRAKRSAREIVDAGDLPVAAAGARSRGDRTVGHRLPAGRGFAARSARGDRGAIHRREEHPRGRRQLEQKRRRGEAAADARAANAAGTHGGRRCLSRAWTRSNARWRRHRVRNSGRD